MSSHGQETDDGNTLEIANQLTGIDERPSTSQVALRPISERDLRTRERNAFKAVSSFKKGCEAQPGSTDALTMEEVHQLLSQALESLENLKMIQSQKELASDDDEDKEYWQQTVILTTGRIADVLQQYEKFVKDQSGSSRSGNSASHTSRRSRRSSNHSSKYSGATVSISSSARALVETERQRIELEKKKKEKELKLSLAKKKAQLDVHAEEVELQLAVNDCTAALEMAQAQVEAVHLGSSHSDAAGAVVVDSSPQAIVAERNYLTTRTEPREQDLLSLQRSDRTQGRMGRPSRLSFRDPEVQHTMENHIYRGRLGQSIPRSLQDERWNSVEQFGRSMSNRAHSRNTHPEVRENPFENHWSRQGNYSEEGCGSTAMTTGKEHDFEYPPTAEVVAAARAKSDSQYWMKKLVERSQDKFDGEPINYLSFRNHFNLIIRQFPDDPGYLFEALQFHLTEKVRNAIRHCRDLLDEPSTALESAFVFLKQKYGKDFEVRRAHLETICDQNKPVGGDALSLRNLLSDLERCKVLLRSRVHKPHLNATNTIRAVIRRLPEPMQTLFAKATSTLVNPSDPGFQYLVDFVNEQCDQALNPFAPEGGCYGRKSKDLRKARISRINALNMANGAEEIRQTKGDIGLSLDQRGTKKSACLLCAQGFHRLQDCIRFRDMGVDNRWKFVESGTGICFSCLNEGHRSASCKSKYACKTCKSRRHHSMLCRKDYNKVDSNNSQVHLGGKLDTGQKSSAPDEKSRNSCYGISRPSHVYTRVLPILAFTKDGKSTEVYALLDSGSDTTIATHALVEDLDLEGPKGEMELEGVFQQDNLQYTEVSFLVKGIATADNIAYTLKSVCCVPKLTTLHPSIPLSEVAMKHPHLQGLEFPYIERDGVDLIIGTDNEKLHKILGSRCSPGSGLSAHLTPLGWVLSGPDLQSDPGIDRRCCNYARNGSKWQTCNCKLLQETVQEMFEGFATTSDEEKKALSAEDEKVLRIFEEKITKVDGHYQLPLPIRCPGEAILNNFEQAKRRLFSLRKQLKSDEGAYEFFKNKFQYYLDKGYLIPAGERLGNRNWYLPYFCTSLSKPRIVYDASAQYKGMSLNKILMSGPDLMQPLVDVLVRFREEAVAFVCDLKEMFYQIKLTTDDQDLTRILWYENGDLDGSINIYKFTVHPFGLKSSPAAANYCLRQCAHKSEGVVSTETLEAILKQFYMDDGLHSTATEELARKRLIELKKCISIGGFTLGKIVSNSAKLLSTLDKEELSSELKAFDFKQDGIPQHKTLGVQWDPASDELIVKVELQERPMTKRGVLSMLSQVFDPLGICQPYILKARLIMQEAFTGHEMLEVGWDAPLPDHLVRRWVDWLDNLDSLKRMKIPRCYVNTVTRPEVFEVHTFTDASTVGLGAVSFLRYKSGEKWHIRFIRGKGRIISKNNNGSVARLELEAAVMGAQLHHDVLDALTLTIDQARCYLWTDSTTVLTWIKQMSKRPKVFVANRRRRIHQLTEAKLWKYVGSKDNPADVATRSISPAKAAPDSSWLQGPAFLSKDETSWDIPVPPTVQDSDLEWVVPSVVATLHSQDREQVREASPLYTLLWKYSDINKLKRRIAWLNRFVQWFSNRRKLEQCPADLTVEELDAATLDIVRLAQEEAFSKSVIDNIAVHGLQAAIGKCKDRCIASELKSFVKLCPFVDKTGLLRVGGRLQRSDFPDSTKHQYILPKRHHVTQLLVEEAHCRQAHFGGAQQTLALLLQKYWVTPSSVQYYLRRCLICEQLRAKCGKQMMAPLPPYRVEEKTLPFKVTGVDYFGPILVKVNRGRQKRWIAVFTCLVTRGVHMEIVHSLTSDSFIQALFRFNNARGNPLRTLVSDNATTFHGANEELRSARKLWDCKKTHNQLQRRGIEWKFNAPLASHQGGVWERLIRSIRKILSGLPAFDRTTPTDENLKTVVKEAEAIVNNRPLTHIRGDQDEFLALTPGMLLTGHISETNPWNGSYGNDQLKNSWRYTQIAAEQFWSRFRNEYLSCLQIRPRWFEDEANLQVGDMVLIKNENMAKQFYPKALVTEVYPGIDGRVRNIQVRLPDGRRFVRDIRKIVPLEVANGRILDI